ncbi:MAG: methylated-DNA--[protein]-cysteine S-methyltransferase [Rhizobiaceae bacterium]|nr:MAG: methylated-DNA--[protein]-cysteine S-methyltransferase [Rhizobiaceae bacterium]
MAPLAAPSPFRPGHVVFPTAIGFIAMAWSGEGLVSLQLPGPDREATRKRLLKGLGAQAGVFPPAEEKALPPAVLEWVERIRAYASGEHADFSDIPLDLAGVDPFRQDIYAAARKLDYGETTTYGELAARAGHPGEAREAGQALGANPVTIVIPCHRIMAAGGRIGGFSAHGGIATKRKLLAMEHARFGAPDPDQQSFGF